MSKIKKDYSKLSIENSPRRQKQIQKRKLGLTNKKTVITPVSFRLRPEIKELLKEMTQNMRMEAQIRLSNTDVIELLIMYAAKQDVNVLLRSPQEKNNLK